MNERRTDIIAADIHNLNIFKVRAVKSGVSEELFEKIRNAVKLSDLVGFHELNKTVGVKLRQKDDLCTLVHCRKTSGAKAVGVEERH